MILLDEEVVFSYMFLLEGNFQDQEQMKIQKAARKQYGRFFYRFPNGESAADVYDRITGTRNHLRCSVVVQDVYTVM